ncbi:MAG: hypothetical protein KF861_04930, partial [Planctomycetaceae bacterium]|nr:hypothetical protein [Planctomycetaceae bacterium]
MWTAVWLMLTGGVASAEIRLEGIEVFAADETFRVPAQVLVEEIAQRTGINWLLTDRQGTRGSVTFRKAAAESQITPEGFQITTGTEETPRITIDAATRRGALFAVGYLLRQLDCAQGRVVLTEPIKTT